MKQVRTGIIASEGNAGGDKCKQKDKEYQKVEQEPWADFSTDW